MDNLAIASKRGKLTAAKTSTGASKPVTGLCGVHPADKMIPIKVSLTSSTIRHRTTLETALTKTEELASNNKNTHTNFRSFLDPLPSW